MTAITLAAFIFVFSFAVYAASTVVKGETATAEVTTTCSINGVPAVIDTDASDLKVTYLYGAWVLKDPAGAIVSQRSPEMLNANTYTAASTFTADQLGTYELKAAIFYVSQEYNTASGSWQTTGSGECSVAPNSDTVTVNVPLPDLNAIAAAINNVWQAWLQSQQPLPPVVSCIDSPTNPFCVCPEGTYKAGLMSFQCQTLEIPQQPSLPITTQLQAIGWAANTLGTTPDSCSGQYFFDTLYTGALQFHNTSYGVRYGAAWNNNETLSETAGYTAQVTCLRATGVDEQGRLRSAQTVWTVRFDPNDGWIYDLQCDPAIIPTCPEPVFSNWRV